jgi:glutamate dehydrogenase (NAD(P)+)
VELLFRMWQDQGHGLVTRAYYNEFIASKNGEDCPTKYSTAPNDLLRESAFCLIPAAPIANYLDTEPATRPCMTVDRMGSWSVIIEGANTYSPDPARKAARARMERAVYRARGVLIATDYLVNSGGVIFAAQERLIKTPANLRIPGAMLGDRQSVEGWLRSHRADLGALAEQRLQAAECDREQVIRGNMHELVDLLVSDTDMLPCEAAERISVSRIASRESDRTAADLMAPIPTIQNSSTVREAAALLVDAGCSILAVVQARGALAGVVTDWDITRATALGSPDDQPIEQIMSRQVISTSPSDSILEMLRKLEYYEISAMPVVDQGNVLGWWCRLIGQAVPFTAASIA